MTQHSKEDVSLVCCGNADAIRFLEDITQILHFWDDLIDKDQSIPDAEINRIMWKVLTELPRNMFYANNFLALNTLLVNAILNWEVATEMERKPQGPNDAPIAFIIRSCYVDLVTMVGLICGGRDHIQRLLPTIRRVWHEETLEGYKANVEKERALREGK